MQQVCLCGTISCSSACMAPCIWHCMLASGIAADLSEGMHPEVLVHRVGGGHPHCICLQGCTAGMATGRLRRRQSCQQVQANATSDQPSQPLP